MGDMKGEMRKDSSTYLVELRGSRMHLDFTALEMTLSYENKDEHSDSTKIPLKDIIGADVNKGGSFRLRFWKHIGEDSQQLSLIVKCIEPNTPASFLRRLSTLKTA